MEEYKIIKTIQVYLLHWGWVNGIVLEEKVQIRSDGFYRKRKGQTRDVLMVYIILYSYRQSCIKFEFEIVFNTCLENQDKNTI